MEAYANSIGMAGVVVVLIAYGLFSAGKLKGNDWRYPVLNIIGTSGILYSVIYQWNLPSFVAQVVWIVLGVVGLVRIARGKKRHG